MAHRELLGGLLLAVAFGPVWGQTGDLPRHGAIGLVVAAADPTKSEDPSTNPPTVRTVLPGSAGEQAGVEAGDVLVELDGEPVSSSTAFARAVGRRLAGDRVTIRLLRHGSERTVTANLKPRPYETSPDADVLYGAIAVKGARRRVIITHPKHPGRHPAVLLVGGLGCYSLDGQLGQSDGYGPILTRLAQRGFVTMRVEKPGEGDSEGPLCADPAATADLEARGYVAGLRALKRYDFVDPRNIFIFAHSLGPLVVSMSLPQESVRGFIAAETIGRTWFEYMLENSRRQRALVGTPLDVVDAEVRAEERCLHRFFVEHEPVETVVKAGPTCAEMISSFAGVPGPYMQQIGDLNLPRQWKQVDVPVLVIYGTSDPATSAGESRYLVDIINHFHPGRATYLEIPGMGHDFGQFASQRAFLNRRTEPGPHPFETRLLDSVLEWLEGKVDTLN
jgi:alpha-beta hydrolase superfamily lysophospholipase